MKFGIFYEHQLPRPWNENSEHELFQEALDQVELADRLGIDYAWEVEHHFLDEYSHSSAPEVFLAACSQRTSRIRLGHGIVLMLPGYNQPARIAERIATLDLVSNGRVEFGTGESASRAELEGFNIEWTAETKREMWREATEQVSNMLVMDPYPGYEGKYFSMPCRNVLPKPAQRPHPPLWLACSNRETIHEAARNGMGALTFAFVDQADARKWVGEYYDIIRNDCVPIGHSVNANIAMVTGFSCHQDAEEAKRRGMDGFRFFGFALGHHYLFGAHKPGRTNIWEAFERARDGLPEEGSDRGIGTPAELREHLQGFAEAGVDQVVFIQQGGRNRHKHICESLELFAAEVMPFFKKDEEERERRKQAELAPYIEKALERKEFMAPLPDGEIPEMLAYGRDIVEREGVDEQARGGSFSIPTEDPNAPSS
ncbi:MAG: LLM class flavin-dependent oxidoreductase [Deltaproteobacteria bacterium]|jgi:alkanesulfonate monooxygenase SsuD/methylene tetrahydromethanopterin reductase-like flavin-dependent oxidoreductase (luciferase family)|nr:LLM class flavin-dependent oxidoreductase [Deltaproteobacteria bacterium]